MNVIEGQIRSVIHVGNRARVRIGPVTAEVTDASVERLGLTPGSTVVASFKATGTRLVPYAYTAPGDRRDHLLAGRRQPPPP